MRQKAMTPTRALYDILNAKYPKTTGTELSNGNTYKNVIITESFLYLIASIQSTQNQVQFNVLVNQGSQGSGITQYSIERRLNITDRFSVQKMSVCLAKAGTTTTATDAQVSVLQPQTYPNPFLFTAANEAANLEAIYNGYLQVTIDSTVFYQSFDMRRFFRVPVSQGLTAVSTVATTGVLQRSGWDDDDYSFAPVVPNFEFSGIGNNQVSVNVPPGISFAGTSSQNFLVATFRGFLIQNVNQKQ